MFFANTKLMKNILCLFILFSFCVSLFTCPNYNKNTKANAVFNVTEKPILVVSEGKEQSSVFVNGVEYKMFTMPKPEWQTGYGKSLTFVPQSDTYEITNNKGKAFQVTPLGEYILSIQ
jgi:hypothetical protein